MKLFFTILIILIIAILSYVYVKISTPKEGDFPSFKQEKIVVKKPESTKPIIYNFPARILYMGVDLKDFKKTIVYKIKLNINDRFSIFNIKALLNSLNLHYSIFSNSKEIIIYVNFQNLKEAKRFFNLFKEYNFNVKLIKQIKRI